MHCKHLYAYSEGLFSSRLANEGVSNVIMLFYTRFQTVLSFKQIIDHCIEHQDCSIPVLELLFFQYP